MQRESLITAFREMLEDIEVLELDQTSADLAAVIYGELARTGHGIDVGDAQNAAIALRHRICVATGNTRHYSRVQELGYPLVLQNWRDPAS